MRDLLRTLVILAAVAGGGGLCVWLQAAGAAPAEETPAAEETPVVPPPPVPEVEAPPIPPVGAKPVEPADDERPRPLIDERKHLFNREGRIGRDAGGRTVFIFDSGDPPMRLLANSIRQNLEDVTAHGKRLARWRVSGQITEYRGANYLLLSKAVRIMPEEQNL